ncbi:threonine/homoserine/homoserine lactone efflux protein [Saccharothrix ecbatanensis]|uniref:Threonine/homoserine/homoserine lactone efflux protein n=1 Tax=Saccharothrix ecbatanensis TaxID=1105145 RepID=A0A7W9HKU5_9PSEU|nr:LysE family transporter [Saccharothrix ecbatanensis]MBB5804060.1 threonine/homoserine/homoserine lactone efflux protein [Saccharothrix ecbatanensis]
MDALGLGLTLGLAASISPGPLLVLVVTSALRSGRMAGVLTACAPLLSDAVVVLVTLLLLDRLPGRALGVLGVVGAVFVVWSGVQTVREARSASLGTATARPADEFAAETATQNAAETAVADDPVSGGTTRPADENAARVDAAGRDAAVSGVAGGDAAGGRALQGSPPRGPLNSILPTGSDNSGALKRAVVVNLLSPHPWIAWATALGPLIITTWRESAGAGAALLIGFYATLVGGKIVIALLVARGRSRLGDTGYRRALACAGGLLVLVGIVMGVEFTGDLRTG